MRKDIYILSLFYYESKIGKWQNLARNYERILYNQYNDADRVRTVIMLYQANRANIRRNVIA